MKFTIEQQALATMLKQVSKKMPHAKKSDPTLRLSACAARVFVEANDTVAGVEALVFEDGVACWTGSLSPSSSRVMRARRI